MYLKSLEIHGFKSFANRIELLFGPGITAVVGPNGSGKSNIADAIRWVLGEQSARLLRGSKMEDVIFAGADRKRPLGFAEVSLTLDNSDHGLPLDFAEVTITRRVFRSGESEYYINRVPCRLRDLVDLFMDTGIGKESYSLIEQGKIDGVLSSHPEERRRLLEEAAGIAKYRARKAEATKKLEATRGDLLRIGDIIAEVERELVSLKGEADKAERYLGLKDELRRLEYALLSKRLGVLLRYQRVCGAKLEDLHGEYEDAGKAMASAEEEVTLRKKELASYEETLTELEDKLRRLDEEINLLGKKIELAKGKIDGVREQREILLARKSDLESRLKAVDAEVLRGEEKLREASSELLKARADIEHLEGKLAEARSRFETAAEVVEKGKTDIIDLLNRIAERRNVITRAEAEGEALSREVKRLQGECREKEEAIKAKEAEVELIRGRMREIEEGIISAREALLHATSVKKELERGLNGKRAEVDDLKSRLNVVSSRLKVFLNLRDTHEGYMKGVQAVLSMAGEDPRFSGILGTVADILKVEPRYEAAIEAALGSRVQFIVTESEEDVAVAIDYLKRTKKGRATFLPLTLVRPSYLGRDEERVLSRRGVIGLASSFVSFDPRYERVVMNLLGRVVIIETLRDAMAIARDFDSLRLVTLDGDLINPGGTITGGSRQERNDSNLLGRNRIIEELRVERDSLIEEMRKAEEGIRALEVRFGEALERIEEFQRHMRDGEFSMGELKKKERGALLDLKELTSRVQALQLEIADKKEAIEAIKARGEGARGELEMLVRERKKLEEGVGVAQHGNTILADEVKRLSSEVMSARVRLAAMEEKTNGVRGELERLTVSQTTLGEEIRTVVAEIEALSLKESTLQQEIHSGDEALEGLMTSRVDGQGKLEELKAKRDASRVLLRKAEEEVRRLQGRLHRIKEEIHANEMTVSRLSIEIETIKMRACEEYGLDFEELVRDARVEEDVDDVVSPPPDISTIDDPHILGEIARVKEEMRGLEPVNIGAIEAYKARRERYDFLTSQYRDLQEGCDSLFKVIDEIDKTIRKRFRETYDVVRGYFQEIFEKLFDGGRADLLLDDEKDMLQTGIDIVAQPPGKKLQHLSLLSGGERALTAIAFIFSLIAVKPAPFCILDEIDASLDEANVQRFALLLKEFSSRVQFIVVTHRRPTMEVSDTIYGVTMEETGVSKIISMNFESRDDDGVHSSADFAKE